MSVPSSPEKLNDAVREVLAGMLGELSQQVAVRLSANHPLPTATDETAVVADPMTASPSPLEDAGGKVPATQDGPDHTATSMPAMVPPESSPVRDVGISETFLQEKEQLTAELRSLDSTLIAAREQITRADDLRTEREKLAGATAELEAQREKFEGFRRAGESAAALQKLIWPGFLRDGLLAGWKERLEGRVLAPDAPAAISLLFAALHTYAAAFGDPDVRTLHDALRDVGRRLYAFLKLDEPGEDEARSAAVVEQWAEAINQECAGRGEVEVPVPGNAANIQWMSFQPRGGSSPDITSVRSWCVRDAQKRPVHRAEVIV